MNPMRRIRSIKVKFSIVIVWAIALAVTTSQVGYAIGLPILLRPLIAAVVAVVLVPLLARGMTRPLRSMTQAAREIAQGDYAQRIHTQSVDEVGQLAAAFNAMATDLAAADQQRRDLVANVSHELRTPIAGLKATLENLVDGVSAPTPEVLAAMHGRIDRLHRLVEDLLDLSRLESGAIVLARSDVLVRSVVDGVVEEFIADRPDVDLTVEVPPELVVRADPERLHQVVLNLLDNASRHGTGAIRLVADRIGSEVVISISDNGPGLPAGSVDQVFERFYRADAARANTGGTGLGLAIVRWITELHGGRVTASSLGPHQAPTGAAFTVALPIT
jgi:signal transduction histidine kinase